LEIQFLTQEEVIEINKNQIELYGGDNNVAINHAMLSSAVNAPQATYGGNYLNEFPFEMAAAYLFSLCKDHAFTDGNKRTGLASALVFLDWHGWGIEADDKAQENMVLNVASGNLTKEQVCKFLQDHAVPISE
jgi:death on curing protein